MEWEYLVQSVPITSVNEVTATLNRLGNQGWELVSSLPDAADPRWCFVVLKRPKSH